MNSAVAITNLLYSYGACMDAGNFEGAAQLLSDATVRLMGGEEVPGRDMLGLWQRMVILHDGGLPGTKHVITNPILEIDDIAGIASCRSVYIVLQSLPGFPLQIIAAGRYDDRFGRADGIWRFTFRDYSLFDMQGDLSRHLRM